MMIVAIAHTTSRHTTSTTTTTTTTTTGTITAVIAASVVLVVVDMVTIVVAIIVVSLVGMVAAIAPSVAVVRGVFVIILGCCSSNDDNSITGSYSFISCCWHSGIRGDGCHGDR